MISADPHTKAGVRIFELFNELLRLHGGLFASPQLSKKDTEITA